jgi:hypothetical protein
VYLAHDADPVSRAWQRTLPDLVQAATAMPPGLSDFQRYPEELFTSQLQVLRAVSGRARRVEPYWWAGPSVGDWWSVSAAGSGRCTSNRVWQP